MNTRLLPLGVDRHVLHTWEHDQVQLSRCANDQLPIESLGFRGGIIHHITVIMTKRRIQLPFHLHLFIGTVNEDVVIIGRGVRQLLTRMRPRGLLVPTWRASAYEMRLISTDLGHDMPRLEL